MHRKRCRNPYFIGILSAMGSDIVINLSNGESQSLFYWNPFCNMGQGFKYCKGWKVAILILLESFLQYNIEIDIWERREESQSLFYWNPFCNLKRCLNMNSNICVAILILLESFLQWNMTVEEANKQTVAILILLESFLQ